MSNVICALFSSGVIFIGNKRYALEPALHASNNEHILFPLENSQSDPFVCGVESKHDHGHDGSCDHTSSMGMFLRVRNPCNILCILGRIQSQTLTFSFTHMQVFCAPWSNNSNHLHVVFSSRFFLGRSARGGGLQ